MRNKVVYITDKKYIMPTIVSIQSLLTNNQNELEILVVTDNEAYDELKEVTKNRSNVSIIDCSNIVADLWMNITSTSSYVSRLALAKFFLPELIEGDIVLYLDGDVIINSDISELFEMRIDDYYLAAVEDMGVFSQFNVDSQFFNKRIGVEKRKYFNSGVMLLNLKRIREERLVSQFIDFKLNQVNYFVDQDALNFVLGKECLWLNFAYNFRASVFMESEFDSINNYFFNNVYKSTDACFADQKIFHMTSKYKPWKYEMGYLSEMFSKYYDMSVFSHEKLRKKSLVNELLSENIRLRKMTVWNFPESVIESKSKVVVYGAGRVGKGVYKLLQNDYRYDVILWIDKNHMNFEEDVKPISSIGSVKYDYVFIAVLSQEEGENIEKLLMNNGVPDSKILRI